MNPNILRIRRMFLVPLAILALFDVILIVVLATRLTGTELVRQRKRDELQQEKTKLESTLTPFKDMGAKLHKAKGDVDNFYDKRFPEYYSKLSDEVNKLGQQEGIVLSNIVYNVADAPVTQQRGTRPGAEASTAPGVQPVRISTSISGDYPKIVKFINALERDQSVFFIVEKLGIAGQSGPNQGPGTVSLQISVLTFMRKV